MAVLVHSTGWCQRMPKWHAICNVIVQMATFTELVILREEERVLMKIASKLNDQLNRLKVLYHTTFYFDGWFPLSFLPVVVAEVSMGWMFFLSYGQQSKQLKALKETGSAGAIQQKSHIVLVLKH